MRHSLLYGLVTVLGLLALQCSEEAADSSAVNRTPTTFLWLYPDGDIATGASRQRLHWWGEDADGLIRGFLFALSEAPGGVGGVPVPDTLRYVWTTRNDSTLLFPLDTTFQRFLVVVRSVDNGFDGLASGSPVRLTPFAFLDVNDNGFFDGADQRLEKLIAAMDPKGAVLNFPVRNSRPAVTFLPDPNDPTLTSRQPDTTFTAATFGFRGSDPDGDNTLASYRIALNDTSSPDAWFPLGLRDTLVTIVVPRAVSDAAGTEVDADIYSGKFLGRRKLNGQLAGLRLDAPNVLYVQAKDVAGEYSPAIRMPAQGGDWFVRRPRGTLLLVSDYVSSDATAALATYVNALAAVPGGAFAAVDRTDIARGLSTTDKTAGRISAAVPPFIDPALIHTFLLYDYVIWYTDAVPSLAVAQQSLFTYMQNGGRVVYSTTFQTTADPRGALRDFAPIDSVSSVDLSPSRPLPPPAVAGDTRIPANFVLVPDSSFSASIYPRLAFNGSPANHVLFMRPVYRRTDARYIYHLQPDPRNRYFGTPDVAVVDGARRIIFVGLPLHLLNNTDPALGNPQGLSAFFAYALVQEFSATQHVNRIVF